MNILSARVRVSVLVSLLFLIACDGSKDPGGEPLGEATPAVVEATNRGVAHLENKESKDARRFFAEAAELDPDRPLVWRNLARAELLARDEDAAEAALERAAALERGSAATSYLRGLVDSRTSRFEEATAHFEEAARLDPDEAPIRFQLANAYQALDRHELARETFQQTLELDPLHATAFYRLGLYAQQMGDAEAYARYQREFQRLREIQGDDSRTPEALETSTHTHAETISSDREPTTEAAPRFVDASARFLPDGVDAVATAVTEVAADGRARIVALAADGTVVALEATALEEGTEGAFDARTLSIRGPASSDPAARDATQLVVGDYFDLPPAEGPFDPARDAITDLLVVHPSGLRLWRGEADGEFTDTTAESGLDGARARRAAWVDAEADGDLDLLLATDTGPALWQNTGDGTFSEVTAFVGLATENATPAHDLGIADLQGDVVLDLVVAGEDGVTVFENQRLGVFEARPGSTEARVRRLVVDHFDADGTPDTARLGAEGLLVHTSDGTLHELLGADAVAGLAGILGVDLDLDGWLDVVTFGEGVRAWRNLGAEGFTETSDAWGLAALDLPAVHGVTAADLDLDGDLDLVLATADGARVLASDAPLPHRSLTVRLVGTKTNPLGLGTRLEVRDGRRHLVRQVQRLPITVGLGPGDGPLDAVRLVWTNGIVDNEIGVDPGALVGPLDLREKNVAAGSCPFLYAWDGEGWRFVTDTLGNSPLGLSIVRGVPLDADPDELVWIGGEDALVPRDGAYRLQVTEEMREVLYLDEARLVAVDHPPGVEVHSTDKLMPAPFPPSEIWPLASPIAPRAVEASDGVDRLAAVSAIDGRFAPPGPPLPPPLRGVTEPFALTFDFGPIDPSRPWVLALTGWLQYGDASTNIAVSQGAAEAPPPWLEVETARGFERLDVAVGLPAGKTKTILVDLAGALPDGVSSTEPLRLRLVTHAEVRWDRVALAERLGPDTIRRHDVAPTSAELSWRGFSEIHARAEGHPTTPAHAVVSENPPWRTALEGWVTRYGDVLELVDARDANLALVAAGDALDLAFDASSLPPVEEGLERTFFLYSVGWDKDGDPNVIDGHTVEPLPVVAEDPSLRERYETRFVPRDRFAGGE